MILSPLAPSIDEAVEYRYHFRVWPEADMTSLGYSTCRGCNNLGRFCADRNQFRHWQLAATRLGVTVK